MIPASNFPARVAAFFDARERRGLNSASLVEIATGLGIPKSQAAQIMRNETFAGRVNKTRANRFVMAARRQHTGNFIMGLED